MRYAGQWAIRGHGVLRIGIAMRGIGSVQSVQARPDGRFDGYDEASGVRDHGDAGRQFLRIQSRRVWNLRIDDRHRARVQHNLLDQ
jgi:hypothetical protein